MLTIQIDENKLAEVVRQAVIEGLNGIKTIETPDPEPRMIHSIRELSDFLHVSIATAQRYKNEGIIPYIQVARKCFFNPHEVMVAMKKYSDKK